jgi:hypothetical protein
MLILILQMNIKRKANGATDFSLFSMREMNFLGRSFFALAVTAWCVFCAAAQNFTHDDYRLDGRAVKGSKVSNLDLIRKIFPDARIDENEPEGARAFKSIPLRHLFGEDNKKSDDMMTLNISQREETVNGRGKILWLIINAVQMDKTACAGCYKTSWEGAILAAYRVSQTAAELIDAADIQTSNITVFDENRPKLKFTSTREAVVVWNYANASIAQSDSSVVAAGKNGFDILLSQFVVSTEFRCSDWYSEEAKFRELKTSVNGVRNLEASIRIKGGPGDADYPTVKHRRQFRYVFAWQPRLQKYKTIVNPERQRRAFLKRIEPCQDQK